MSQSHKIEIQSGASDPAATELLSIFEGLMPVKFGSGKENGTANVGRIAFGEAPENLSRNGAAHIASLVLPPSPQTSEAGKLTSIEVKFADDAEVPFPFRARAVTVKVAAEPKVLTLKNGEKALAKTERGVFWSVARENGTPHFRSAFALPAIPPQGSLFDVLNGERFVELLPLLQFLRSVSGEEAWDAPPVRAQFMFDDPNLHWPRYGYVGYRETATHAERENYHVSFATIPLDAWYIHGKTAQIFRSNTSRLSLCVHGNDHTKRELAQDYSPSARVDLLRQALRRIERLEKKSGVPVSRVMVPPHGACLHEMLEELPKRGFESACISSGSLRSHNRARPWTKSLGYLPAELIGDCPVMPRWAVSNSNENTVLLAAYLRQPIVLRGHHQDIKEGIELLDKFARIVNGLGPVIWGNMAEISRLNYFSRLEGDTFRVKPFGKKLTLKIPEAATGLVIENPANPAWDSWQIVKPGGIVLEVKQGDRISVCGWTGRQVVIETGPLAISPATNSENRLPAAAIIRRLLTEGRDRLSGAYGSI